MAAWHYLAAAWAGLPAPLHRAALPLLRPAGQATRALRQWLRTARVPEWLIEGNGVRIAFAGPQAAAPYLQQAWLGKIDEAPQARAVHPRGTLERMAAAPPSDCDLLVLALPAARAQQLQHRVLPIPQFIGQLVRVPASDAEQAAWRHHNRELQKEINKVERLGFAWEVTRDEALVREFYETCHRPYILKRHGAAAHVDPWPEYRRYLLNDGALLRVLDGGKMISGVLLRQQGACLVGLSNGVLNGDFELLRAGALAAEYYFSLLEARRRGCTAQQLGRSRAFLRDGVLQFKRKFGGWAAELADEADVYGLAVARWSGPVCTALAENPVMARLVRPDGAAALLGCVFLHGDEDFSDVDLAGRLRRLWYPGLWGLALVPLNARWRARCAAFEAVRARVRCPLRVIASPAGAEGLPAPGAWPALLAGLAEYAAAAENPGSAADGGWGDGA